MKKASNRPSLMQSRFWEKRKAHYVAVFERALRILQQKPTLPVPETELTRELYFALVTARLQVDPDGRFGRPSTEAQNLPNPDSEKSSPHEQKRPDFQWVHDAPDAPDDRHTEKSFVIECKRLGQKTRSGWNLIENYVSKGVDRFRSLDFRYGNHMEEGLMIGFLQNMDLSQVFAEVNGQLKLASVSELSLEDFLKEQGISRLKHQFARPFPVSPFSLLHLWVDIRGVPQHAVPQ